MLQIFGESDAVMLPQLSSWTGQNQSSWSKAPSGKNVAFMICTFLSSFRARTRSHSERTVATTIRANGIEASHGQRFPHTNNGTMKINEISTIVRTAGSDGAALDSVFIA